MNFIRLQQINVLCFSPVASERTYTSLVQLIADHHRCFVKLYPDQPVTPKLHYLVHLPRQLQMFVPLRHHSYMRMEGKHGLFKTRKWSNFKALKNLFLSTTRFGCACNKFSPPVSQLTLICMYLFQGEALESVAHLLDASVALSEVDTKHKRDKYLEQKMGAVMPRPIVMGEHIARRKHKGENQVFHEERLWICCSIPGQSAVLSYPCLRSNPV